MTKYKEIRGIHIQSTDTDPEPYPRHFGITFHKQSDFDTFIASLEDNQVELLNPISTRFDNMPEMHKTFFLKDPSNNILELFKYKKQNGSFFFE